MLQRLRTAFRQSVLPEVGDWVLVCVRSSTRRNRCGAASIPAGNHDIGAIQRFKESSLGVFHGFDAPIQSTYPGAMQAGSVNASRLLPKPAIPASNAAGHLRSHTLTSHSTGGGPGLTRLDTLSGLAAIKYGWGDHKRLAQLTEACC